MTVPSQLGWSDLGLFALRPDSQMLQGLLKARQALGLARVRPGLLAGQQSGWHDILELAAAAGAAACCLFS